MNCTVIIPVGPGHEQFAEDAERSVAEAWAYSRGHFDSYHVAVIDDTRGEMGRSRARNLGMDGNPADWHFLLDADDRMEKGAFRELDRATEATFGAVTLNGKRYLHDVQPVTRQTLFECGAHGTLCMGCFVRGDLGIRFDESLDKGEDFDFYLRLPGWTKRRNPLVSIGYDKPSAGGPRGYEKIDWLDECQAVIDSYRGLEVHTLPAPPGLIVCESVLDVGAGIRPMRWYRPGRHVCVEPHPPYADRLIAAGYQVVPCTAVEALADLGAEAVYLLDVIEHMERDEALEVLALAQQAARRQVVIFTPLGFVEQTEDAWNMGGEHWQTHRSGWTPEDFPGWTTHPYPATGEPEGFYALWEPSTRS